MFFIMRFMVFLAAFAAFGINAGAEDMPKYMPENMQEYTGEHGIAMQGAPHLAGDFSHYAYANPKALQGGTLRQVQLGSFDSINPFTIRGNVARGIRERVFESLLDRNYDESFALYGLLADSVTLPPERHWIGFTLNPQAYFSDGVAITSEDVKFSLEILRDKGRPNHRYYYSKVSHIETPDPYSIIFHFDAQSPNRELPLIIGLMPILPKHIYEDRDIQSAGLEFPVGSGAYRIEEITPGSQVRFARDENYWGAHLPVNEGKNNYDLIIDDYFRDEATAFEAFKAGEIDIWVERNPQRWQGGFNFPAARDGRIIKEAIKMGVPSGLRAFVLNTRRPVLKSPQIRRALNLMFDFEWVNKVLYGNVYQRTISYFGNTPLSATNTQPSQAELALLANSTIAQDILTHGYQSPVSDGSGRDRQKRAQAIALLESDGYRFEHNKLLDRHGQPVTLEVIVQRRADERLALSWRRMLAQIGIDLSVRLLDTSQYQRRLQNYDFDIIIYNYYTSLSPGNEQAYYWGSEAADTAGTRNYAGIKDPAIDTAIAALTTARTPENFQIAARALDRALMNGAYFVPLYYNPMQWIARWHYVEHPDNHSLYGARLNNWWLSGDN